MSSSANSSTDNNLQIIDLRAALKLLSGVGRHLSKEEAKKLEKQLKTATTREESLAIVQSNHLPNNKQMKRRRCKLSNNGDSEHDEVISKKTSRTILTNVEKQMESFKTEQEETKKCVKELMKDTVEMRKEMMEFSRMLRSTFNNLEGRLLGPTVVPGQPFSISFSSGGSVGNSGRPYQMPPDVLYAQPHQAPPRHLQYLQGQPQCMPQPPRPPNHPPGPSNQPRGPFNHLPGSSQQLPGPSNNLPGGSNHLAVPPNHPPGSANNLHGPSNHPPGPSNAQEKNDKSS